MNYYYANPNNEVVGPVAESELRVLFANGTITAQTNVVPEGSESWVSYAALFPSVTSAPPPQAPFQPQAVAPVVAAASPSRMKGPIAASWVMIGITCLVALIPGIGFVTWLIAAPILFITIVLGIIAMNKGATTQGILILLFSIIVAPAFLFFAPIVSTVLFTAGAAGAASSSKSKAEHQKHAIAEAAPQAPIEEPAPVEPPLPQKQQEAAPAKAAPSKSKEALSMGEMVTFKDSAWVVLAARELGSTLPSTFFTEENRSEGRFIYVRYKVTNKTKSEEAIVFAPVVKDSEGREFEALSEINLPDNEKTIGMEALPAGIPKTFSAVFEIAEDSKDLCFMARSFEPFATQYKPVLLKFSEANPPASSTSNASQDSQAAERQRLIQETNRANEQKARMEQAKAERLAQLKGELAKVDSKIETDRTRWQNGVDTINRLTNFKRTPVQEGSYAYRQCKAASEVIQEVEAGASELKAEKARLEATIKEIGTVSPTP